MKTQTIRAEPNQLADLKTIVENLKSLPSDQLIYVAGATAALAASAKASADTGPANYSV